MFRDGNEICKPISRGRSRKNEPNSHENSWDWEFSLCSGMKYSNVNLKFVMDEIFWCEFIVYFGLSNLVWIQSFYWMKYFCDNLWWECSHFAVTPKPGWALIGLVRLLIHRHNEMWRLLITYWDVPTGILYDPNWLLNELLHLRYEPLLSISNDIWPLVTIYI